MIGEWNDMKQGLKMHKRVSQPFQQFPYRMLKQSIEYKAGLYGINVMFVDETYTSHAHPAEPSGKAIGCIGACTGAGHAELNGMPTSMG